MTRSQLIAAGLLTSVCISKHVIILNEEVLVLLSFLAFLAFCAHTLSESTEEAMQARGVATLQELQHYLHVQRDTTRALHDYHTLCLQTRSALEEVAAIVTAELQATTQASEMVKTLCVEQTRERADTLVAQQSHFQTTLHTALRASFRASAAR